MIRYKRDQIEPGHCPGSLDFDRDIVEDRDWWRQQDAEMEQRELEEIEVLAEIQEYRTQGYM